MLKSLNSISSLLIRLKWPMKMLVLHTFFYLLCLKLMPIVIAKFLILSILYDRRSRDLFCCSWVLASTLMALTLLQFLLRPLALTYTLAGPHKAVTCFSTRALLAINPLVLPAPLLQFISILRN